ncbi:MAG TPA: glycosyltransferase family 4 protein [Terriglobales bacterium]|nr:glycosyltransferase family 4 protein [Terriglobales bacterium]
MYLVRVAIIAPPFISVPPRRYGGTELFIAQLAAGLRKAELDVVVYTNGESSDAEARWLFPKAQWPIKGEVYDNLKDLNHTTWAIKDAARTCDLIHINNAPGLTCSRFVNRPFVDTLHHPHIPELSDFYAYFPEVHYVTISDFQLRQETMPHIETIHHGLDLSQYRCCERKQEYLAFLGRIAPIKGPHLAIKVAKEAGIPLKIAGEVQPMFREYFDAKIRPHLDGNFIEYNGEADLAAKNELLGHALAMLFPIQWDEPFGLVMLEAMACGTPVLALPGGSVGEVIENGVNGFVCRSPAEMAAKARQLGGTIAPQAVRQCVQERFSLEHMAARYVKLYQNILAPGPASKVSTLIEEQRAAA